MPYHLEDSLRAHRDAKAPTTERPHGLSRLTGVPTRRSQEGNLASERLEIRNSPKFSDGGWTAKQPSQPARGASSPGRARAPGASILEPCRAAHRALLD